MSRLVLSSDLHLGHKNICKFRGGFESAEQHHEHVLEMHKQTIKKNDTWYCLGDCAFTKEWLLRINEIKCKRKVIILGNHDNEGELSTKDILEVFDEVYAIKAHKSYGANMWFTHCPIHPSEMRKKGFNIHGHTHNVMVDDPRYINVCVEHTGFGVISLEEILNKAK